jgi:hypothetical protein
MSPLVFLPEGVHRLASSTWYYSCSIIFTRRMPAPFEPDFCKQMHDHCQRYNLNSDEHLWVKHELTDPPFVVLNVT